MDHEYNREVSLSLETFLKYRKKKIKRFDVNLIIAAWYKIEGVTNLFQEEGSWVDQLIFNQNNKHCVLQGYVFKTGN